LIGEFELIADMSKSDVMTTESGLKMIIKRRLRPITVKKCFDVGPNVHCIHNAE
jgi:hypothetical protein